MSQKIEDQIASIQGPILVIGASGFIGLNLFKNLKSKRSDVIGTTYNGKNERTNHENFEFHKLDITNLSNIKKIIEEHKIKTIFNLASYGNYSWQTDVKKTIDTNILGLQNLLTALKGHQNIRLIQAGSSSEYGSNVEGVKEDDPSLPNSLYGITKKSASDILRLNSNSNILSLNLRLFSVYGKYEESNRFIPTLISNLKNGTLPKITEGDNARDFIHIDDVVVAFIRAAIKVSFEISGSSINICSGKSTLLKEVVEFSKKEFEIKQDIEFSKSLSKSWDLSTWYGNNERASFLLGLNSYVTIEEGVKSLVQNSTIFCNTKLKAQSKIIDIIIPCYYDQKHIPIIFSRIEKVFETQEEDFRVLYIVDGGQCESLQTLKDLSLKDSRAIGIFHTRSFSSQNAFMTGLKFSNADAVVLMDADLQDPPELIEKMIQEWKGGKLSIIGNRVDRKENFLLKSARKLFYRVLKKLSKSPIEIDAGDFSLLDKKVYQDLIKMEDNFLFIRTMRSYLSYPSSKIDYTRDKRLFGHSTNSISSNIEWAIYALMSVDSRVSHLFLMSLIPVLIATFFLGSLKLILAFIACIAVLNLTFLHYIKKLTQKRAGAVIDFICQDGQKKDYPQ
ncbi:NAD-dependent epimerase/dehydratase family protein [bacterium]|nr:NAD-dependent epimerase/dehydratase family protein [bacterium]